MSSQLFLQIGGDADIDLIGMGLTFYMINIPHRRKKN